MTMTRGFMVLTLTIATLCPVAAAAEETVKSDEWRTKLQAIVREHDPQGDVTVEAKSYVYRHHTRKFKVHTIYKTGEVADEAHDEEGPNADGILMTVTPQDGPYRGAAKIPQELRRPYWTTYINSYPVSGGKHLFLSLSYGARADRKLLSALKTAFGSDEMEKSRAAATEPHIARENIEWCNVWIPDLNEKKLPRVLLIGDSITHGYYGPVAEKLKGKATVARLTTSKSLGDPVLPQEVALVLGQCRFDVVHFNNGLHGMAYSEAEYEQAFPELLATIRKHAPAAKLIWATTTPTRERGNLGVLADGANRVQARNKITAGFTAKEHIDVDDLYDLVKDHPEYWSADGIHFNAQGIAAQAEQVAKIILAKIE